MLKRFLSCIGIFIALVSSGAPPQAFWHGLNTTFDPNRWGGAANVFCLTAAIPGTCNTGYNASCNGTSDDTAALNTARTAAIANNPTQWVLYFPPGVDCGFLTGSASFVFAGASVGEQGLPGVNNAVVWAYGATFRTNGGMRFGGTSFFEDTTHDAFIVSANAGDTTVTLITAADSSIFTVGDWIAVTGLELETCCGFPPNFQRYEFHTILSITGTTTKVVTLDSALKFTYLSTWPSIQSDSSMNNNGPAKIFKLTPSWNVNLTVYGGTVKTTTFAGSQDIISGKFVTINDMTFLTANTGPSASLLTQINGSSVNGMEVDKVIDTLVLTSDTIGSNLTFQSPVPINFYGSGLTIRGELKGTPWNSTFTNTKVLGTATVGPNGFFGVGNSIAFGNSSLPSGAMSFNSMHTSDLTFSAGTFSIAHASSAWPAAVAFGVPGHKYTFTDNGSLNSVPLTTFVISAVRDNGTTLFFDLSNCSWGACSGFLPVVNCGSHMPCDFYVAYPAATITQTNSGPADLTQFAAPP